MSNIEFNKLCEDTRQGKNICQICNKPKEMYFTPWCPRCDKPKIENLPSLNFIKCLNHIEAIDEKNNGFKNRFWGYCSKNYEFRNDSYFMLYFPNDIDKDEYTMEEINDLNLFRSTFNIKGDSILLCVSW